MKPTAHDGRMSDTRGRDSGPRRGAPTSRRGRARRPLRPAIEGLEDRTLLDATPIPAEQVQGLSDGTAFLFAVGGQLDRQATLVNTPHPYLGVLLFDPEADPVTIASYAGSGTCSSV